MSVRTIWSGSISWGALVIPVKLAPTVRELRVELRQVHKTCGGPVGYRNYCKNEDVIVGRDDIAKGLEVAKGEFRTIPEELVESEDSKVIELSHFAKKGSTPRPAVKEYWLLPDSGKSKSSPLLKPYQLLRTVLEEEELEAVVSFAMRARPHLARIVSRVGALLVQVLPWPEEVLESPQVDGVELSPDELQMGRELASMSTREFDPAEWVDKFSERINAFLDDKTEARPAEASKVVDLMTALRVSVDEKKETSKTPTKSARPKRPGGPKKHKVA